MTTRSRRRKPTIAPVKWTPTPVDTAGWPTPLTPEITVVDVGSSSPEDVVADNRGRIWTGTVDGNIIAIDAGTGRWDVVANTGGQPLGLEVIGETLLICDSRRGLLSMDMSSGEIRVVLDHVDGEPLTFCSNVIVTRHSGGSTPRPLELHLTQSTTRFSLDDYKADIIEHGGSGRLIRVDLGDESGPPRATVLLTGLQFANGLVTHDGRVIIAETGDCSLRSWEPTTGTSEVLRDGLPGYPDNCSLSPDGEHLWLAMAGLRSRPLEVLAGCPRARRLVWKIPERLLPEPVAPLWVLKIHLPSGRVVADHRVDLPGFGQSTGVSERDGRVWVGGIGSPRVAWFDLE
ncbi:SMP-30/gluconolactonase/LRE family protein [Williamsia soli]|uniref:SMP-30/gluconolactonase/LRE family protein n=1 Tax=Williamsia soli TaxID=364929 RepID=UPI001A9E6FA4|nr:SMP-30/gluconolactonase/LRE family protein [Williamsia soli]